VWVFLLVVLTDSTPVADTSPASALTDWMVVELVVATPVEVASDATLVSIVPVLSNGGAPAEAAVFVCVTPTLEVQPSVDNAERPDCTVDPT
jgi:hypothetical protein